MEILEQPRLKEKDYSGVANWQLAGVIVEYLGVSDSINDLAERVPMDSRDLRNVLEGKTSFNGLNIADRVLLAMGMNVTALAMQGILTIIPAFGMNAARKMAADEFWVRGIEPTPEEVHDRAYELVSLRDQMLSAR